MIGRARMLVLGVGLGALVILCTAALGGATGTVADHTYHGCYQANGNVYLVAETGLDTGCRNNDTGFAFNLRGPIGPAGPQGQQTAA